MRDTRHRLSPLDDERCWRLHFDGYRTVAQIAQELGTTPRNVRTAIKRCDARGDAIPWLVGRWWAWFALRNDDRFEPVRTSRWMGPLSREEMEDFPEGVDLFGDARDEVRTPEQ